MTNVLPLNQPNIYRKEGILVVEAELPENFNINAFIDELREERIQDKSSEFYVSISDTFKPVNLATCSTVIPDSSKLRAVCNNCDSALSAL